jgi:hypothetical protein
MLRKFKKPFSQLQGRSARVKAGRSRLRFSFCFSFQILKRQRVVSVSIRCPPSSSSRGTRETSLINSSGPAGLTEYPCAPAANACCLSRSNAARNKIELASRYRIREASCTSQFLRLRTSSYQSDTNQSGSSSPASKQLPRPIKDLSSSRLHLPVPSNRDLLYFEDSFASARTDKLRTKECRGKRRAALPQRTACLPESSNSELCEMRCLDFTAAL